jgi:hypothetical protein
MSVVFVSQRWQWGGAEDVRGEGGAVVVVWWWCAKDNYGAGRMVSLWVVRRLAWPLTREVDGESAFLRRK